MGSARTPKCSQSSLGSRSPSSRAKGTCSHARSQWPLPEDPTSSCPVKNPPDGNHRGTQPDSQDNVGGSFSGPCDPENKDSHFSVRYSVPSSSLPSRTRAQAWTWLQLWKTATHTHTQRPSFPNPSITVSSRASADSHGPGSRAAASWVNQWGMDSGIGGWGSLDLLGEKGIGVCVGVSVCVPASPGPRAVWGVEKA